MTYNPLTSRRYTDLVDMMPGFLNKVRDYIDYKMGESSVWVLEFRFTGEDEHMHVFKNKQRAESFLIKSVKHKFKDIRENESIQTEIDLARYLGPDGSNDYLVWSITKEGIL